MRISSDATDRTAALYERAPAAMGEKRDPKTQLSTTVTETNEVIPDAVDVPPSAHHALAFGQNIKAVLGLNSSEESWRWEIVGCIANIVALVLIIVVLAICNGKPLPQLPFKVKLGSVLSILLVVYQGGASAPLASCMGQLMWIKFRKHACLLGDMDLYESASRGIWGCCKLVFKGRARAKECLGVLICVLLLLAGPFTQNTLGSGERQGPALLQRCVNSNENMSTAFNTAFYSSLISNDWSNNVADIYDSSLQQLNHNCTSGNCDWPIYNSLGVCSKCVDVTEQVDQHCAYEVANIDNQTYSSWNCNRTLSLSQTNLTTNNYTCSALDVNGNCLWTDPIYMAVGTDTDLTEQGPWSEFLFTDPDDPDAWAGPLIAGWSILRNVPSDDDAYEAQHCSLYFCVQAYKTAVRNFSMSQDVTYSWYPSHGGMATDWDETLDSMGNFVMSPLPSEFHALSMSSAENFSVYSTDFSTEWIDEALYSGEYYFALNKDRLNALDTGGGDLGNLTNGTGAVIVSEIWNNLLQRPLGSVDSLFEFVSNRMTNAFRATCPSNVSIHGTVHDLESVLEVEWPWLALPATASILSVVFLAIVIMECRTCDVCLWKTYALPKLYSELHGRQEDPIEPGVADISRMQKTVGQRKVKLERDGNGNWVFETLS